MQQAVPAAAAATNRRSGLFCIRSYVPVCQTTLSKSCLHVWFPLVCARSSCCTMSFGWTVWTLVVWALQNVFRGTWSKGGRPSNYITLCIIIYLLCYRLAEPPVLLQINAQLTGVSVIRALEFAWLIHGLLTYKHISMLIRWGIHGLSLIFPVGRISESRGWQGYQQFMNATGPNAFRIDTAYTIVTIDWLISYNIDELNY